MNYADYKISRNLSWEILINENIRSLPVSVSNIAKSTGIDIKYYISNNKDDGYSTIIDGKPTMFINYNAQISRKRFTAAHELGHILLGHVGKYKLVNREPSNWDNPIEQAANVFASRLLAPACVLWALDIHTAQEIADLCHISLVAAEYRLQRMNELYKRDMFLTSPLERRVYAQFKGFIRHYRKSL